MNLESIQIEPGIPVPEKIWGRSGGHWKNIFLKMKDGDSILLPAKEAARFAQWSRCSREHAEEWIIMVRAIGNGQSRVWKVKREA